MSDINPYSSPVPDPGITLPPRTLPGIFGEAAALFTTHWAVILMLILGVYGPFELIVSYVDNVVFDPEDLQNDRFDQILEAILAAYFAACIISIGRNRKLQ